MNNEFISDAEFLAMSEAERQKLLEKRLDEDYNATVDKAMADYQGSNPEELAQLLVEAVLRDYGIEIPHEVFLSEAVWALDDGTLYDRINDHLDELGAEYQDNAEKLALLFQESVLQKFSVQMDYDECLEEATSYLEVRDLSEEEFDELMKRKYS